MGLQGLDNSQLSGGEYYHNQHCDNCGKYNALAIPKGTTVAQYLIGRPCYYCGVDLREYDWGLPVRMCHPRDGQTYC